MEKNPYTLWRNLWAGYQSSEKYKTNALGTIWDNFVTISWRAKGTDLLEKPTIELKVRVRAEMDKIVEH